ncbi:hypothetical protein GCM10008097_07670 [Mycetocola manganoxydans]|nr:hypothetical protein GCM10008097_07670 [Mycetocola manganoxydans]
MAVTAGLGLSGCASPAVSAPAPTKATQPIAVFIGDSYTSGYGASIPTLAWASLVASGEGWKAVNLGRGGTGYLATSGLNGCGKEYCPNYQEMVAEAVKNRPDVVVVAGGQNDFTAFTEDPDATRAAIEATYDSLREGLPDARIIAVGPSIPAARAAGPTSTTFDALVKEAAESVGGSHISLIDPPIFTAAMILPDAAHVNDEGHAAIAARIEEALAD